MVAPGAKKPSVYRLDTAARNALEAQCEALTLVEEQFCDFDIVWAKVHGFPWWPGVLFFSWDVVQRAGIRTDPKIVASLVVPPPTKVPVMGASPNKEKDAYVMKRHCLIMFLDKFNFSLVEIHPNFVASFTAHYHLYEQAVINSKSSKFVKKKSEFRRALIKATELLHMGKEYTEDDLMLLEEPSQVEKKQRLNEVVEMNEGDGEASLDDAWDDREMANDAAFNAKEESQKSGKTKAVRKSTRKVMRKMKQEAKWSDVEIVDDSEQTFDLVTPRRKFPAKVDNPLVRKSSFHDIDSVAQAAVASRSPFSIDLTSPLENEKTGLRDIRKRSRRTSRSKKKVVNPDASPSNQKDRVKLDVLEDEIEVPTQLANRTCEPRLKESFKSTEEKEPVNVMRTPLSSIWTTEESADSCLESKTLTTLAYRQDFVWDDQIFTDEASFTDKDTISAERQQAEEGAFVSGRDRTLGKRQSRSVQQSQIRQNLMTGNLDPHTMVQCAAYRARDHVEDPNSRSSRGGSTLKPPFEVAIHPDAVFVADLHAHLATCEVIGFLGGKWNEASKTLYIQAAFPCRSLEIDGDDGSTDVEMDPGSEIEVRGIIENAQLEVVGWYHSHPAFAPDPSVRDIENQTSYQQLFQRPSISQEENEESKVLEPFVGLIVGTYDTRRISPVSLFRYFHTRGEKVNGSTRREIFMPYELIPSRRHFRSVLRDEECQKARLCPMYPSVSKHFKLELTATKLESPADIKNVSDQKQASKLSPVKGKAQVSVRKRKQSSDVGDMFVKKAKSRGRRPMHFSRKRRHLKLTSGDAKQDISTAADKFSTAKVVGETGCSEIAMLSADEKLTKPKDGTFVVNEKVVDEKKNARIDGVIIARGINDGEKSCEERAEVCKSKLEMVRGGEYKVSHQNNGILMPKQDNPPCVRSARMASHASSNFDNAAKTLEVLDCMAPGQHSSLQPSSALSSELCLRLPPSNSAVSSRKRTRKPQKTTKNRIQQYSPISDGPSSARSPSPHDSTDQVLDQAFRAQGSCISNQDVQEKISSQSSSSSQLNLDGALIDDVQYIVVDENVNRSGTLLGGTCTFAKADTCASSQTTSSDDLIDEEVQSIVLILVEQVAKKVAIELITVPTLKSAPSNIGTYVLSENGLVQVNGKSMKPCLSTDVETRGNVTKREVEQTRRDSDQVDPPLFGSNRKCEDIQTSLQTMAGHLATLKEVSGMKPNGDEIKHHELRPESKLVEAKPIAMQDYPRSKRKYLQSLRTKYGRGVIACTEQAITLVDYYRCFERRTDLSEMWKARITKLDKIASSLLEYVRYLNIPCDLRQDYIKDLTSYLRESWAQNVLPG